MIMTQQDTYSTMLLNLWSQFSVFKKKKKTRKNTNSICPSIALFETLASPKRDNSILSFCTKFEREINHIFSVSV